jgi:hypothetical protein
MRTLHAIEPYCIQLHDLGDKICIDLQSLNYLDTKITYEFYRINANNTKIQSKKIVDCTKRQEKSENAVLLANDKAFPLPIDKTWIDIEQYIDGLERIWPSMLCEDNKPRSREGIKRKYEELKNKSWR